MMALSGKIRDTEKKTYRERKKERERIVKEEITPRTKGSQIELVHYLIPHKRRNRQRTFHTLWGQTTAAPTISRISAETNCLTLTIHSPNYPPLLRQHIVCMLT